MQNENLYEFFYCTGAYEKNFIVQGHMKFFIE